MKGKGKDKGKQKEKTKERANLKNLLVKKGKMNEMVETSNEDLWFMVTMRTGTSGSTTQCGQCMTPRMHGTGKSCGRIHGRVRHLIERLRVSQMLVLSLK